MRLGAHPINPATGRVNVTPDDVTAAEAACRSQVLSNLRFLRGDEVLARNPADVEMVRRVLTAARETPAEALRLMRFQTVNALFQRGALFFSVEEVSNGQAKRARKPAR